MIEPRRTIFPPPWKRTVLLSVAFVMLIVFEGTTGEFLGTHAAAQTPPSLPPEPPAGIANFIEKNCVSCHDSATPEGDLDLEALGMNLEAPDNFHHWERIYDRVRDGEMPPDEELGRNEKKLFITELGKTLLAADAKNTIDLGRVSARRLTRAQYERNVWDLLQIEVPLQEYLPAESLDDGYDTVSSSQQISDHALLAYLHSADVALDSAFDRVLGNASPKTIRLDWEKLRRDERRTNREPQGRPKQKDVVAWNSAIAFYGRMRNTTVEHAGRYKIRLRVQAVNPPEDGTVWCSLETGLGNNKDSVLNWIGGFEATKKPKEYEFVSWMREGHQLLVAPRDSSLPKARRSNGRIIDPTKNKSNNIPGVAIKWIEMERLDNVANEKCKQAVIGNLQLVAVPQRPVLRSTVPSKKKKRKAKKSLPERPESLVRLEIVSRKPQADLRKLTLDFAQRAFRRPVTAKEVKPYADFAVKRFREDKSFVQGLRAGYRAVLCSPRFLYFEETPGKLDDYALANRLSHFLWGRGPDEKLLELAADGTIGQPELLAKEVERMLDDDQSEVFVNEFTEQWLKLYEINETNPDSKLYPEYDDTLHHSLLGETYAFVTELIEKDLPITNVVDSNFTFLNKRLARHYGIKWPGGEGMKRVKLKKTDRRGGIITHGSVLKVTANGTTTSPILRGVWMLDRIVGQHVPPPPSNVPAVEPDIRGATSIRSQLAKHRNIDTCASCHVKIDPPGFALESYDVIGGFRTHYRTLVSKKGKARRSEGKRVDPSSTFVTGAKFKDIRGLKKLMLDRPEVIAKAFASHLITYATGAEPTFADRSGITAIAKAAKEDKYGARSIIEKVVLSPQFQYK